MSKTKNITIWTANIIVYILNIITICVTGPTLINNIIAWCCGILLALGIMHINNTIIDNNIKRWERKNEQTIDENEKHF